MPPESTTYLTKVDADFRRTPISGPAGQSATRRVLNVGSGPFSLRKLHPSFVRTEWQELRLDIDPNVKPDIVGTITDIQGVIEDGSFDAIWCSHVLEHLHSHEIPNALQEIRRILKPDGFVLLTSPDMESVAELILSKGIDHVAYVSPAGPITVLDMIYGHSASIARGRQYMAHNSGFTVQRLGDLLVENGFDVAFVKRGEHFDIWAVGLKAKSEKENVLTMMRKSGLDLHEH